MILSCHLWPQKIENFTTIQSSGGAVLVQGNHISMASPIANHKLMQNCSRQQNISEKMFK